MQVLIGDLFSSSAQTWVNTVNEVGIMGKGVALGFKKRFPQMYEDYAWRCERGQVKLGRPYIFNQIVGPQILNFPTKGHWRSVSKLSDIVAGLEYLEQHYVEWGIESLAVPPLGCGNGGLDWTVVGPTLYQHLERLGIPVELYAPMETPGAELRFEFLERGEMVNDAAPPIAPAWLGVVAALDRIQSDPHHWPIGKTSFQKLAYFGQVAGLPLKLEFERGAYGPYAQGLASATSRLVNNDLIEQFPAGRMTAHRVGPTFENARGTYDHELSQWDEAIGRLADLFARFRTTKSTELAASVHFASSVLGHGSRPPTENDVLAYVVDWKQGKKPPYSPEEIATSLRSLEMLGWLDLQHSEDLPVNDEALAGV